MLKKKPNPRGPKKRKVVMSLQTCEEVGVAVRRGDGGQGPGAWQPGSRWPHLELPEHQVRVEVELEGAEEFQLLWDREHVRRRRRATSLTPSCGPGTARLAHHCGRGEDAGRGVGSCHRGHLQEARRQPRPSHRNNAPRARRQTRALYPPRALPRSLREPIGVGGAEPGGLESQWEEEAGQPGVSRRLANEEVPR